MTQDVQQPSHLVRDKPVVRKEVKDFSCSVGIVALRWKSSSDSGESGQQLEGSYWCLWPNLARELNTWRTELVSPKLMLSGQDNRNSGQSCPF